MARASLANCASRDGKVSGTSFEAPLIHLTVLDGMDGSARMHHALFSLCWLAGVMLLGFQKKHMPPCQRWPMHDAP